MNETLGGAKTKKKKKPYPQPSTTSKGLYDQAWGSNSDLMSVTSSSTQILRKEPLMCVSLRFKVSAPIHHAKME